MNSAEQQVAMVEASDIFDGPWYLDRYRDVAELGLGAAEHYVLLGGLLLRDPGPQFCARLYVEANLDVADSGENPLLHYLEKGRAEGRACFPVPVLAIPDETPKKADIDAAIIRDMRTIRATHLFDADYYAHMYADVRKHGMNPLLHYVKHGASEGRQPNPFFSTRLYRQTYQAKDDETNSLIHYLTSADNDNARTSALFDGRFYASRYADVRKSGLKPLEHYLSRGLFEGRQADFAHPAKNALPSIVDCRRISVSIIIPVHNARDATLDCLQSVLRHTELGGSDSLLVIDDASTDAEVRELLESFATVPGVSVVCNAENMGYTRTINKGCELAGTDDVVLLNSDTVVSAHWLRNLKVAAYRGARTGTVTAVSNNAGAFSVPHAGSNGLPDGLNVDAIAKLLANGGAHPPFEVPTGNGFCMYVKRQLIDAIGPFDAQKFPVGYGEENDFCMRALQAGRSNMVDPLTYVGHVRSASFGERRQQLAESGLERVQEMHPTYFGAVRGMAVLRGFQTTRYRLSRQLQAVAAGARAPKPRIMYVISTRVGGTPQTNADLMHAVSDVYDCYALWCDRHAIEVLEAVGSGYRTLQRYPLSEPIRFATHVSGEYDDIIRTVLVDWAIDIMHVRHLAWHSLNLVDVAKSLGIPVVNSFHDFYTICPSVTLVGNDGVYVPTGVAEHARNPLWRGDPSVVPMTPGGLEDWQRRTQQALSGCDAFVTTCQSAKDILTNALADIARRAADIHVIPHGRDFAEFSLRADTADIAANEPLRVLLPGNIGLQKGMELIKQVRLLDTDGCIEFHLLGKCDPSLADIITDHGSYTRFGFDARVAAIRPHMAVVWSIGPESWCHTLTECWASGLPVLAVDLGAVGERIEQHQGGWLVSSPATPEALYEMLLEIRRSAADRRFRVRHVERWQKGQGRQNGIARMAERYLALYRDVIARHCAIAQMPLKRTALVRAAAASLPRAETSTSQVSRAWLRNKFGQPVDNIDWSALLRAELDSYSIIVLQPDAIPGNRKGVVTALLAGLVDCQVLESGDLAPEAREPESEVAGSLSRRDVSDKARDDSSP